MRKGSIFILSIWAIMTLAVFSFYIGHSARAKISFVAKIEAMDKIKIASEAAVLNGIAHIKEKSENNPKLLYLNVLESQKSGDMNFKMIYNNLIRVSGYKTRYFITDEESKININKASVSTLTNLIKNSTELEEDESKQVAESVLDWVDADNERPGLEFANNEDLYYKLDDFSYIPKNSEFNIVEEVLLVKNMTPDIYQAIRKHITVYGRGAVNINTCHRDILLALGLSESVIDKIAAFRLERHAKRPRADGVFEDTSSLIEELNKFIYLSDPEKAFLSQIINSGEIGVDSEIFNLVSIVEPGKTGSRFFASSIVDKNGKIRYQKEDFIN